MPAAYEENEVYGPFCKKPVRNGTPDSIAAYNNSIKEWVRVLKQNEDEKLAAVKAGDFIDRNRSFHASSPVEKSEEYEMAREDSNT